MAQEHEQTFLDLLETIEGERATARSIYGAEAREGYRSRPRATDPDYLGRVQKVAETLAAYHKGKIRVGVIEEAMSTSDFPNLFGDIIDRTLLGGFRAWPAVYEAFAAIKTVRDFKTANIFAVEGSEGQLSTVAQGAEYPAGLLVDEKDTIAVTKYGRRLPFTWETIINDDLGAFLNNVARLGRAAARTRAKNVTKLYIDTNGPHASLYSTANKNILTPANGAAATNPPLSTSALMDALIVLSKMTDYDGEPILVDGVSLVVGPALAPVANNIINAVELRLNDRGGTSNELAVVRNWLATGITPVVDPYIPIVATTNGNTSWALFGNPNDNRPAIMLAKLAGHEEPETFMKEPNAVRVGGGEAGALDGSFESDSIDYKVRDVFGTSRLTNTLGYKTTVASNGSNA